MAEARFKFGDIVENGYAGEGNPHKRGIYLWSFTRIGRLNPGRHVKLLHDDGKTGELLIADDDKMTVVGTIFEAERERCANVAISELQRMNLHNTAKLVATAIRESWRET